MQIVSAPRPRAFVVALFIATAGASLPASAKPWKGAEVISQQTFLYGAFEARILAARGSGLITPFFLWKNDSELPDVPWQEQDFEIFGRNGRFQTQLMTPGEDGGERTEHNIYHTLPDPAWERYYTYRMEWTPNEVAFYVDGELIRVEDDPETYAIFFDEAEPAQIRLSIWASDSNWSGRFDSTAVPAAAFVNYLEVYAYTPGDGPGGGDFTRLWRDDFDRFDNGRWWTANWTFDSAINDYVPQNAATRNGALVLAFTDEDSTGTFPSVPPDTGGPSDPNACGDTDVSTTYQAEQLPATTGGATAGGWNLWSNGSLAATHSFAGGDSQITVRAAGAYGGGSWPHMIVEVGGVEIGETFVTTSDYQSYDFTWFSAAQSSSVTVRFDNDYYANGQDRNLLIDAIVIDECES